MPVNVGNTVEETTFTIASSGTTSEARRIKGSKVFAFIFGTMTGTTLTFTVSNSYDGTYVPLYDDAGNQISITVTDDACVGITSSAASMALASVEWVKVVSGSSEAAERTITMLSRG